ncbi:N-acetylmuramoyl-L-alanine amidase [Solirubrobacter taibaiensis]|nr:N-acetylmuramoyl-L-alanine amidase [Solirubrobacter taibaiensis]
MPAQQLRNRLLTVFSDTPWQEISPLTTFPNGIGARISDVKALVVHQTSGWAPRSNGREMFRRAFLGTGKKKGLTTQLYISGDGTVMQGMELPRKTHHATFVNNWAIGVETAHPFGNYGGNPLIGPWSSTSAAGAAVPLRRMAHNHWLPMSGNDTLNEVDEDFPGLKFYIRVAGLNEPAVGLWTTPRFAGPWRNPVRVPEALFSEQQYRAWALLARWFAEEYQLPRNFSLYPWKSRARGFGDETNAHHEMIDDAVRFREIVLADEGLSRSPQRFGLPATPVPPTAAALEAVYPGGVRPPRDAIAATATTPEQPALPRRNDHWENLFRVFRGFHGHGYSGASTGGDDHDCPGPLFDWHRFARETWDWWWWPFDHSPLTPDTAVDARPYSLPTRNGNTPLKEYYWDQSVLTVLARRRPGVHGNHGSPATFELPEASRIYAMANGELVAARFPTEGNGLSLAFMLVRHEVFHRLDPRPANPTATPPVFANRIDYNEPPTTVYSLYMHLGRPPGMNFDRVVPENPDWLNRVLTRKKECELGVRFRNSAAGTHPSVAPLWNNRPPGAPRRPTLAEGWAADNTALGMFLLQLSRGEVATAPTTPNTTPVNILLGDYLAHAGNIGSGRRGVRVEVFANEIVSPLDFTATDTSGTTNDWHPGPTPGDPVVRYRSEWARNPTEAEALTLALLGVTDFSLVNWWRDAALAALARDPQLDLAGFVQHYDPLTFLPWLNGRTWRSEWPKYRATDPAGIPARPRPR